jgi:hypothetical protein
MRPLPESMESGSWEWGEARLVLELLEGTVWKTTMYEALWRVAALHEDDREN